MNRFELQRRTNEGSPKKGFFRGLVCAGMLGSLGLAACDYGAQASGGGDNLIWKTCSTIGARFRAPASWYLGEQTIDSTKSCIIQSEPVSQYSYGPEFQVLELPGQNIEIAPSDIALKIMSDTSVRTPLSGLQKVDQPPWKGYRGYFRSAQVDSFGKYLLTTEEYAETVYNDRTNTFYIMSFITPEPDWPKYSGLATTMIETASLDQNR